MAGFDPFSPSAYGLATVDPVPGGGPAVGPRPEPGIARSAIRPEPGIAHVDNPLLWFGIVAGVTLGLIGVSTSARVGPLRGAISAGKS